MPATDKTTAGMSRSSGVSELSNYQDMPTVLRPFIFHGLDVQWREGRSQATADCPFCTREGKWYCDVETSKWACMVCGAGGNSVTFLQQLWQASSDATSNYQELSRPRGLLYPETLIHWGLANSIITKEWLAPAYNHEGKLNQLYRYDYPSYKQVGNKKRILLATSEVGHGMFGVPLYNKKCKNVFLVEGLWNAMVLWEVLRYSKCVEHKGHGKDNGKGNGSKKLQVTASATDNMLAESCILATPGCNVFQDKWATFFGKKRVFLCYDNDHPKEHKVTKQLLAPAAFAGMQKVAATLILAAVPPSEIRYLRWGEEGQNHNPDTPSGYDLRDLLSPLVSLPERVKALEQLLNDSLHPIPQDWLDARTAAAKKSGGTEIQCAPCTSWKKLIQAWKPAMTWTDGLNKALAVMLASVVSTKAVGEQLWVIVMSPASTGKTTLCEALGVNRKYTFQKDTMTGIVSGYQTDREGTENHSLVPKIKDKTLLIKDGDTVLNEPNLGKILSQFRAFYDKSIRTQYGNKMSADHEGIDATVIICGTASLYQLDTSELGERFLKVVAMENIDDEVEDAILWRVANRANRGMEQQSDGYIETKYDPDLLHAMQLTGGYVGYLRENANQLLKGVDVSDEVLHTYTRLGKFVSYMRARQSTKQDDVTERELAARLVSQITRLGRCLAVVMNEKTITDKVLNYCRAVALDTARGKSLTLAKRLATFGRSGIESGELAHWLADSPQKVSDLLKFLRRLGAVESFSVQGGGMSSRIRWRLSEKFFKVYQEVFNAEGK